MSHVDVSINGRAYSIACEDGQEEHVGRLADYIDHRIQELIGAIGQVGDARLLVMSNILIADELSEVQAMLEAKGDLVDEKPLVEAIESLADRIENIAALLEAA